MTIETLKQLQAGQLVGAQKLALNCGLSQFPAEIFDLAESLEILDLSNNCLRSLPDDFGRLKNLKAVFFVSNEFEEIPEVLAQCPDLSIIGFKSNQIRHISDRALSPTLRWLILTNNQLEQLPPSIGNLSKLQKLMLAGNCLQSLPPEMANCQSLELIRLSANRLTELPPWLLALPRLSWLAYASNPFCEDTAELRIKNTKQRSPLPPVNWADLVVENTLGEGASGIISKARWQTTSTQSKAVAVKVFKGEITSDGSPEDEMQACIGADAHPNLVSVLGKIQNHPEQKAGLLLALIPPDYKNLGSPPSLETCTRDTYAPDTSFSFTSILQIALGISAAAAHLHHQGIMHGDLYAHNILVNDAGDSLLGDFGAASFHKQRDTATRKALEQLEVRAFGCLLQDLLNHHHPDDDTKDSVSQQAAVDQLRLIEQKCMNPTPTLRPLFTTIYADLTSIKDKFA